jgi:hypothetical protein
MRIEQDVLKEFSRLGESWMVMFVVQARQAQENEFRQLLLTRDDPVEITCNWDEQAACGDDRRDIAGHRDRDANANRRRRAAVHGSRL